MNTRAKRYAVSLFALLALMSLRTEAHAASVQVRAGGGGFMGDNRGSLSQGGVDVFLYEGRRMELFVGAEAVKSAGASTRLGEENGPVESSIPYSLEITAATFGLRFKPALSGSWRPYLSLGGIAGKAAYQADASGLTDAVLLSTASGSTNFVSPRLGLGMDFGLGEQWSLGIEANYTAASPALNAVVANYNTGRIEDVKVNGGDDMVVASVGLRYAF